jgi:thiamine pyrophosphokinase
MAGKRPKLNDDLKTLQDYIKHQNRSIELDQEMIRAMTTISSLEKQRLDTSGELRKVLNELNEYEKLRNYYVEQGLKMTKSQEQKLRDIEKQLKTVQARHEDTLISIKKQEEAVERQRRAWVKVGDAIKNSDKHAKSYWGYLMSADQAIRDTVKAMGAFGTRSQEIRDNIYSASESAARLGVTVEHLAKMQGIYSDELGTQVILTEKNLKNISAIAEGTILGVENAARLSAEFASIGGNADNFRDLVQGVVESTERMALNTGKVLHNMNTNFKAIQKYNFKQGVSGIADMSMYATKFKIDIQDALQSTDRARTLEGAIDMMSRLQVLGGTFAESDPFEMLFLARNDPEKYTKKLNEMTKGMANLVRTASGFEFQITALDRDRLKNFADATGQDYGKVIEQAMRRSQIDTIRQQLTGLSLKDTDRELIENMAQLDKKSGKFMVGTQKLTELTKADIERLKTEAKTLEERAVESQNFNKVFQNTIMELKASLLPILDVVNSVLKKVNDSKNSWINIAKVMFGAATALGAITLVVKPILGAVRMVRELGGLTGMKSLMSMGGGGGGAIGGAGSATKSIGGGTAGGVGPAAGGAAKSIAAFGAAAAGVGAGVGIAAAGIGFMAEKFKELDPKQIAEINGTITRLGLIMVGLSAGIVAVGMATGVAAAPMLAFGGAVALVGAGVGMAAAGLGYFAQGIATVLTASKEVDGNNLLKVGAGIGSIGLGLTTMGNPLALLGLGSFAGLISLISSNNIGNTAANIANMVTTLKGSASDLAALEGMLRSISNLEIGENSVISKLSDLANKFEQGLKVEFANKDVALNVNVTANLDGEPILRKLNVSEKVKIQFVDERIGRGSGRSIK